MSTQHEFASKGTIRLIKHNKYDLILHFAYFALQTAESATDAESNAIAKSQHVANARNAVSRARGMELS